MQFVLVCLVLAMLTASSLGANVTLCYYSQNGPASVDATLTSTTTSAVVNPGNLAKNKCLVIVSSVSGSYNVSISSSGSELTSKVVSLSSDTRIFVSPSGTPDSASVEITTQGIANIANTDTQVYTSNFGTVSPINVEFGTANLTPVNFGVTGTAIMRQNPSVNKFTLKYSARSQVLGTIGYSGSARVDLLGKPVFVAFVADASGSTTMHVTSATGVEMSSGNAATTSSTSGAISAAPAWAAAVTMAGAVLAALL